MPLADKGVDRFDYMALTPSVPEEDPLYILAAKVASSILS